MEKAIIEGHINITKEQSHVIFREGFTPFKEIIRPGILTECLRRSGKVHLLFNHDYKRILADPENIDLYEDDTGLTFTAHIDDIEIISKCYHNQLKGCSIKFVRLSEFIEYGRIIDNRTIYDMELLEVSILEKEPAYSSNIKIIYISDNLKLKAFEYYIGQYNA